MKLSVFILFLGLIQSCDQPFKDRRNPDRGVNSATNASGDAVIGNSSLECSNGAPLLARTADNTGTITACVDSKEPIRINLQSTIDHLPGDEICVIPAYQNSTGLTDNIGTGVCQSMQGNSTSSFDLPKDQLGNVVLSKTEAARLGISAPSDPRLSSIELNYSLLPMNAIIVIKAEQRVSMLQCLEFIRQANRHSILLEGCAIEQSLGAMSAQRASECNGFQAITEQFRSKGEFECNNLKFNHQNRNYTIINTP